MDRILIIGISGAGKSTFANRLGKELKREVTHLDILHHKRGWKLRYENRDDWKDAVRDLVSKEKWIIDGHYNSTLKIRLPRADIVIFFNFNKFLCLYRVCTRVLDNTQPFDQPHGNNYKLSWNLLKKLIIFPHKRVLRLLDEYKEKKIYIVKNDEEAGALLKILTQSTS